MSPVDLGAAALAYLVAAGLVSGAISVWVLKRGTASADLRTRATLIVAHLLEFRLFGDEPALIFKVQWDLITANGRLLRLFLVPLLWLLLPFLALMAVLDGAFGHAALTAGQSSVITVQYRSARDLMDDRIGLKSSRDIAVESPPVRVPADAQVSWRVRALSPVSASVQIDVDGRSLTKTIAAGKQLRWLSTVRAGTFRSFLLHPLEFPFSDPKIEWISIEYPSATLFGTRWVVWFFLASLAGAALALMRQGRFAVAALVLTACLVSCGSSHYPSVIVLGVDGMDPGFVERHWGALPNLSALRNEGSFLRLATTTPPQSPVAWSTFITGLEPAGHGIFDFVERDPRTLQPFSSMSRTEAAAKALTLGPYLLPLSSSRVVSLRQGTPFWVTLAVKGVPVEVIRMPTNYPPEDAGRALAGMGTPDLTGTLGTFTFYTDDPQETSRTVPGGRIVKATFNEQRARLILEGPRNSLRKDGVATTVKVIVDVDPDEAAARIKIGENAAVLREGEWSDWISAEFPLIPHLSSVTGMVRIFAKQLHPALELYFSPINIDPLNPALPISAPREWSKVVAREAGRYYTMGTPEDTSALRQNVFRLAEFRAQTKLVFEEEHRLLQYSLRHFRDGLLFVYFSSIDQNSHMLWSRHEADLLKVYQEIDMCIGEVSKSAPGAELIVMSDHGFTSYYRSVHLNTWLKNRGFLGATGRVGDESDLSAIDWPSTKAYALGLNGLYVNLKGREAHGIVSPLQRRAVIADLRQQLLAWRDPLNGRQIVESVEEISAKPHNAEFAPDLIIGYARGYRASWQTGLGGMGVEELEDNTDAWIGDHCINAADVPGVLFTSRKIAAHGPRLQDVTASVLGLFGFGAPPGSNATSFYH